MATGWRDLFVGREHELEQLRQAWLEAKAGKPQLVAIVAETGFGKTRLVQEFFNWLSTTEDGVGENGYWPDRLLRVVDNLQVNPDPRDCAADGRTMPFLWWGLRLNDPGGRNEIITTALRPAEEYLKVHLTAYLRTLALTELRRRQALRGGTKLADVGLNLASMVPGAGAVFSILSLGKTLGEAGQEAAALENEIRNVESAMPSAAAAALSQRTDLTRLILEDIRRVVSNPPAGMAPIPAVIFVDDAQWLRLDPTLCALVRMILAAAAAERWPLLIVATSWEKEWRLSGHDAVSALFAESGINRVELMLGRATGLGELVDTAFPGLSSGQADAMLARADGNPRFLDEILSRLHRAPGLFVGRDQRGALTRDGEILVAKERIEEVVRDRLQAAPAHVQGALGLASLQGIRFSPAVVVAIAAKVGIAGAREGLLEGEIPFAFVSGSASDTGEFRARFYHAAARDNLPNLIDVDLAERTMREALVSISTEGTEGGSGEDILAAQVALFDTADAGQRTAAFAALAELIRKASARHDLLTAGRLAVRWASEALSGAAGGSPFEDALTAVDALTTVGEFATALSLLDFAYSHAERPEAQPWRPEEGMAVLDRRGTLLASMGKEEAALAVRREALGLARHLHATFNCKSTQQGLAAALNAVGDSLLKVEGAEPALAAFEESMALRRTLDAAGSTYHSKRDVSLSLERLALVVERQEGIAKALPLLVETLALKEELLTQDYNPQSRRDLTVMLNKVGRALAESGDADSALPCFVRSVTVARAIAQDLKTLQAREDLCLGLRALGENLMSKSPKEALPLFREANEIWQGIAGERKDLPSRHAIAGNLHFIGCCLEAIEGPGAALPAFEEAEAILRELARQGDYGESHARILITLAGATERALGPGEAAPIFLKAEQVRRQLAEDCETVDNAERHALALESLARTVAAHEGPAAAVPVLQAVLAAREKLVALHPSARAWANLGFVNTRLFRDALARWRPIRATRHWTSAFLCRRKAIEVLIGHDWPLRDVLRAFREGTVPDLLPAIEGEVSAGKGPEAAAAPDAAPVAPPPPDEGAGPTPPQAAAPQARNAPCSCGSGKRFKHCHGKIG